MAIHIITDSTAYLTEKMLQDEDIRIVPLNVMLQGRQYREGIDLNNRECYRIMRSQSVFPTTSQPSVGDFLQAYRPCPLEPKPW